MNDWFFRQGGRNRLVNWLGLDSWLDSSFAEGWERAKNGYSAVSSFFARFRLTGWRRYANEAASEAMTLGAGGLIVLYALALPAFREIEEGRWKAMGQFSVTFQDVNGNEIGKRGINLNDAVPLEEIPDYMINAALATEDRRFFEHIGIDFLGTTRALIENVRANDVVQGGSTITQQLAKNLFLTSERSITRKIKEVFLSLWLESRLSKREILKLYLDRAYMGGGAFGVEAASQFYFGKSVREINMSEAALLAGLFKAPTKYAPHVNLPLARARTSEVLSNLVEAGFYTAGEVHLARLNPAKVVENRRTDSPDNYLDWAFEEIQRIMKDKGHYVLTARTTIDLSLQKAAEEALLGTVRGGRGRRTNPNAGALVSMEPNGAVRAMVGGTDYGESQFNRATHARRQPGSSFKLYVYAAALQNGFSINSSVRDSAVSCGRWAPKNYSGGHGSGARVTLANAFKRSLNTTAVFLSLKVGRNKVVQLTKDLGIQGVRPSCSMALGDTGITPLEHTGGFATFANGGKLAKPYAILEVFNSKGELVYSRERDEAPPPRIFSPKVVEQMNRMMQLVVTEGTGRRAALDFTHAVGKTGTSSSYRDAWFMGFTGKYVTGVWLGNDDYRPVFRDGRGVTGGSYPAQTWQAFMSVAHKSMDIPPIMGLPPHPTQVAERQRLAEIRRRSGVPLAETRSTSSGIMPKGTREALADLAKSLRQASGQPAKALPAKQSETSNGNSKSGRSKRIDQRDTRREQPPRQRYAESPGQTAGSR
ncbi:MAG: hypothetical protein RLZ98_2067 [Pseudomonadota bacterium]